MDHFLIISTDRVTAVERIAGHDEAYGSALSLLAFLRSRSVHEKHVLYKLAEMEV